MWMIGGHGVGLLVEQTIKLFHKQRGEPSTLSALDTVKWDWRRWERVQGQDEDP
jgi:hypothetical protein